jgi:hypothetical protein
MQHSPITNVAIAMATTLLTTIPLRSTAGMEQSSPVNPGWQ